MKSIASLFFSLSFLWGSKKRWPLILLPLILGLVFYGSGFYYFFDLVLNHLQPWLVLKFGLDSWGIIIKWLLVAIISILSFFFVNFTFVLIISLIGAPFNDLISESVEKEFLGLTQNSTTSIWNKLPSFFINEAKKIFFIIIASILALSFSFIPLLLPITLIFNFMLVAIQFIDYSWSRHFIKASECRREYLKNFFSYTFSGGLFFILISIPIINIFIPSWAAAHFTILRLNNIKKIEY